MNIDEIARVIIEAKKGDGPKGTESVATVVRIEGGTAWVHFDGGVPETPVSMTIGCRPGDKVIVRMIDGKAWIAGNATAPPTDDKRAEEAYRRTRHIKADQIDVEDLFAQDIRAAGTIRGAKIKGASGEFTKDFKVETPFMDGETKKFFCIKMEGDRISTGIYPKKGSTKNEMEYGTILQNGGMDIYHGQRMVAHYGETVVVGEEGKSRTKMTDSTFEIFSGTDQLPHVRFTDLGKTGIFTARDTFVIPFAQVEAMDLLASHIFQLKLEPKKIVDIHLDGTSIMEGTLLTNGEPVHYLITQGEPNLIMDQEAKTVTITNILRDRLIELTGMMNDPIFTIYYELLKAPDNAKSWTFGSRADGVEGVESLTAGDQNVAAGENSAAIGDHVRTEAVCGIALGRYNKKKDALFVIGNGYGADPAEYEPEDVFSDALYLTQQGDLWIDGEFLHPSVSDTGWQRAVLNGKFDIYGNNESYRPTYRKIGSLVYLRGYVTPKEVIPGSAMSHLIFTLPAGYRPKDSVVLVCQGTGSDTWTLRIVSNGSVTFERYGAGSFKACNPGNWLPFNAMFFVN